MKQGLLLTLTLLLAACTGTPKPQLAAYTRSVEQTYDAARPLIHRQAQAERAAARTRALTGADNKPIAYPLNFDPALAASFASAPDALPPGAATWNRALTAILLYNQTLAYLAEGRNIAEAQAQVAGILSDTGTLLPGVGALAQPLAGVLASVFQPLIQAGNDQEFRRLVLAGEPEVIALLEALQAQTRDQYAEARAGIEEAADAPGAERELTQAEKDDIAALHTAFADYVLMLDANRAGITALAAAVRNPAAQRHLAEAAAAAQRARTHADAIRTSLAGL